MAGNANYTRNITASGHVDHGKTTYIDSLLAANNIISTRMAGKLRYLDSREDEQERGITMEASAVSLRFSTTTGSGTSTPTGDGTSAYTVNLIDTPGHVDFSSEVSASSRLCDGALVLVDVVEGVCTQTISVLRQARADRLKPILILNKFDRIITELKLTPLEGYQHLARVIEDVNAVMGSFFASERLEDDLRWREEREKRLEARKTAAAGLASDGASGDGAEYTMEEFKEKDDEDIYFSPERGNVIFASAIDGWAFRIGKFAKLFSAKLGINENNLKKVLWGDFYLDPKTKRVILPKHLKGRNLKPLFVQFVMENIWAVYDSVIMNPNPEKVPKIINALNLKILPRDLNSMSKNPRHLLSVIFSQWLPLATCTVQAVIDVVPPPSFAQRTRLPKIIYPDLSEETTEPKSKLEEELWACSAKEESYVVAYVSKMFAVQKTHLPEYKEKMKRKGKGNEDENENENENENGTADTNGKESGNNDNEAQDENEETDEALLGFSRIYSGRIKTGTRIAAILPKYNTALSPTHRRNRKYIKLVKIAGLYTMMGRDLVPVKEVPAGNVFAVAGLDGFVGRSATLCAPSAIGFGEDTTETGINGNPEAECLINLGKVHSQIASIVRVALEPAESADMQKMIKGLKLLSQADPCVDVFQQQTGEWVIMGAGELHLERCLKDLKERFAKVEIQASEPIVPFRETAIKVPDMQPSKAPNINGVNAPRGTVQGTTSHNLATYTVRAIPLPEPITTFLQANQSILVKLEKQSQHESDKHEKPNGATAVPDGNEGPIQEPGGVEDDDDDIAVSHGELIQKPTVLLEDFWSTFRDICKKAGGEWAKYSNRVWAFGPNRIGPNLLVDNRSENERWHDRSTCMRHEPPSNVTRTTLDYESSLESGFQIATLQGPMCAEPVQGMAFVLESLSSNKSEAEQKDDTDNHSRHTQVKGSLISGMRDACRKGMLDWSPRLLLAMYSCDIQATTEVLGKVYSVVARRKGRIVAEEMKEGTTYFTVSSLLPVVESFGFSDDIRKQTSGAASPQLIFSGYEVLDLDPFWVPRTEEELEDLGEKADRANVARLYMDKVRERKGMFVDKKLVEFAEKQRTLKH